MKITIYELLGLVKDGKAPKKIKYRDKIWEYVSTIMGTGYQYYSTFCEEWKTLQNEVYLEEYLNDYVEIIEEDKKIEKLNTSIINANRYDYDKNKEMTISNITADILSISKAINELIDEVNKLKEGK